MITSATDTVPSPLQSGHEARTGAAAKRNTHAHSAASEAPAEHRLSTPRLDAGRKIVVLPSAAPRADYRN
jgi:hypothetical protein